MAEQNMFLLQVISPDRIFYKDNIEMLEITTTEGDIGVLKGHIPLTAILNPGVLRIKKDGKDIEAALHAGFIKILGDKVTILAESCEWPGEIDLNRAQEAKIRAERRLSGEEGEINLTRAELALRRSLLRIQLTQKR
jgi:F-type H+-transporting ATPase subunit epsilon